MSKIALEKLTEYLEKNAYDAIFIYKNENVRYISSYTGDDSYLLIDRKGRKFFITDPRYTEQAAVECSDYKIIEWRKQYGSVAKAVVGLSEENGYKIVGYEADVIVVSFYNEMLENASFEPVALKGVVEELRSHKTKEEMGYSRAACDITCRAFERILEDIRVGITEKELAARLSLYMVLEGADTQPYGNILISGKRTSLLHGIPSSKAVEYGDLVLMDFGCQYNGYMSDMTRTVVVGQASAKQKEVYALEQGMVQDVENFIKDGVKAKDAYGASLKAIENTEYLPYHYTGIGHGVGLFVHELPFMGPNSEDVIYKDNIMTVEPGIYIPGWGGIRIEDQILVTETGNEILTWADKELIEL